MTRVLTPSLVCTVTSPWSTRRPRACRQPPPRPSTPALALALSALAPGAWVVVVAPWAARAAPPADTSSSPATTQPSQPVRLPSLRILPPRRVVCGVFDQHLDRPSLTAALVKVRGE